MKDALCEAFCDSLTVREVPAGLAVGTSFRRANGDAVGFYVVFDGKNRSRARIEDDGQTMPMLEAAGVDFSPGGPRATALAAALKQSRVQHDEDENLLHTDFMPNDRLPSAALEFVAFLIRVQEFVLLTRENVEETFKDDVIRAVRTHYADRATVLVGDEVRVALADARADVAVVPKQGLPLAVFIGTSEPKALEATLLWSDIRAKLEREAKVMLVLDSPKPPRIREHTVARAMNRFSVVVFPGMERDALAAMDRTLYGEDSAVH